MRIAVTDLGTNTCNLLIAGMNDHGIEVLHHSKAYVRLGDQAIANNTLSPGALERIETAIGQHVKKAAEFKADKIRVVATSAVRQASNGSEAQSIVRKLAGVGLEIVTGEQEAAMIFNGVALAVDSLAETSLILDIGGGSNEVIIARGREMWWKESFPAGMSRIVNGFHLSDPIAPDQVEQLESHFRHIHYRAFEAARRYKPAVLIGCSGAFNTIADIIDRCEPETKHRKVNGIEMEDFKRVYSELLTTTRQQRDRLKGMDPMRSELIVPALILINTFIEQTGATQLIHTAYALREGVMAEEYRNWKNRGPGQQAP